MERPKFLTIENYTVDITDSSTDIMDKILEEFPDYVIIGPINIKYTPGRTKIVAFNLKLDLMNHITTD